MQQAQTWGAVFSLLVAAFIAFDASRRGLPMRRILMWVLGAFLFWIVFLPLYLYERARSPATPRAASTCRYCRQPLEGDPSYCPHCAKQLKGADAIFHKKQ